MTFDIVNGYVPGCIGRIAELHGTYYHRNSGFGLYFESKVATELSAFLERYDEETNGLWILRADDKIEGSIAIDCERPGEGAHLRWFIAEESPSSLYDSPVESVRDGEPGVPHILNE